MSKYTISEDYHSKKGKAIWLVKPIDKLEYNDYKKLESKIKILGGYYSRFTRSFVFDTKPSEQKLDEAFGGTQSSSDKAKEAGVPESKLAKIELGGDFQKIDRGTLRREYNDKKLLVAKTQFFDGMIDSTRSIPESEWKWSDTDYGFEKQFDYSQNAYVSGDFIKFGDYRAKYKEDIVQPIKKQENKQTSFNFYVDVDKQKNINKDNKYELDRIDSDSKDHEKGDRVIVSMYGNKYCGYIIDKDIRKYQIRSWTYGGGDSVKEEESVYYKVKLDNGVVRSMATFKIDTDNECDEISADAIYYRNDYMLAEQFWSQSIVDVINRINSLKRQKAARKKEAYALQDQKAINAYEAELMKNFGLWLGWEAKNKDYSREITGESKDEQYNRTEKWLGEYDIKPVRLIRPKSVLINKLIRANNLLLN